jgi:hypothetical protein
MRVLREQCPAGAEIDHDRARLGRAHVSRAQRAGELLLERVVRPSLRGGHEDESDDRGCNST